jgi:hypothetical protein
MKRGKIIWLVVLLCCILLGVWQRHNLYIFWSEYHCLWRDYDYYEHCLIPRKPLIPENIARIDPEAAAVANMVAGYYEDEERPSILAKNLLKFPDNEYFLFSFINEILNINELDQGIAVKLATKLTYLGKDNSLYHYLKAAALLADRRGDDITPALDEINTAASFPNFYFPYMKYSKRAIAVAKRGKLHPDLTRALTISYPYAPAIRSIYRVLLRYANRAFTDGENEKGLRIDDAINSIGRNQLDAGYDEARFIMNSKSIWGLFHSGEWVSPEMLELQRAKITEQRARQNRLQLCPYVLPRIKSEDTKELKDSGVSKEPRVTSEQMILSTAIAVHNGRMLFAISIVLLILATICELKGWSGNQRTGFGAMLFFAAASLCYFFVNNWLFLDVIGEIREWGTSSISYNYIMRPMPLAWGYILDLAPIYFVLLICPILAMVLLWAANQARNMSCLWKILLKVMLSITAAAVTTALSGLILYLGKELVDLPDFSVLFSFFFFFTLPIALFSKWLSKLRLVRVILAAMPLGVLTIITSPYAYISQIPLILFVVICGLIVLNKPSEIPFMKTLQGVFNRGSKSAAVRSRAVKLLAIFLIVHWLLFIASVPTCAQYISQLYSGSPRSYPRSDLAPADETSYQQVLAKFDSNDFSLDKFYRFAILVMPEDLPLVLSKFKKMSFDSSYPFRSLENPGKHSDANFPSVKSLRREMKLRDYDIIEAMQNSGRDVVNIFAESLDNPDGEFALVIRARLGDVRVKEKLEQVLATRIANGQLPNPNERRYYWDKPKFVDIICALACISEPNEAGARFMDYVARSDISQLTRDYEFFRGIQLLPTPQARKVIKAYLAKAQNWQPPKAEVPSNDIFREDISIVFLSVREALGTYVDRDISEAVLKIMLRSEDRDIIKDWGEPWEIPQDFDIQSADLLRQGLASKNEQLRAWCVWQLRKVGYEFSEEEETRLLADESWKVRANTVIAGGRKTTGRAAKDPNPFVRWVASLIAGE